MPRASDFLERFRPAVAPGPAGQIGVPGDRQASAERELAPVFAALEDVQRQAAANRRAADRAAHARLRNATEQAQALETKAERDAKVVEAEAAAHVNGPAAAEGAQIILAARAEAARLCEQAAQLLPGFVALVGARVRTDIDAMRNAAGSRGCGDTDTTAMQTGGQEVAAPGQTAEQADPP